MFVKMCKKVHLIIFSLLCSIFLLKLLLYLVDKWETLQKIFNKIGHIIESVFEKNLHVAYSYYIFFIKNFLNTKYAIYNSKQICSVILDKKRLVKNIKWYNYFPTKNLIRFLVDRLNNKSVFFDIGANVGIVSLIVSKCYKRSNIYSFEQNFTLYKQLIKNIRLNNIKNIRPYKFALSNNKKNNISSFKQISTLDKIINRLKIKKIDLVYINLNGNISQYIDAGIAKTISISNIVILDKTGCHIDKLVDFRNILLFLNKKGFVSFNYNKSGLRLIDKTNFSDVIISFNNMITNNL